MTDIIDQACDLEQKMREFWLLRQKEQESAAPSAQECEECGEIIPEARREAVRVADCVLTANESKNSDSGLQNKVV